MSLLSIPQSNTTAAPKTDEDSRLIGRLGTLGHRCWNIEGSDLTTYYSDVRPAILESLDGCMGSVSHRTYITITAYMIGRRVNSAAPTVLFVSNDSCRRKAARQFVKNSQILNPFPRWKTAHASEDPRWGGRLEQLAAGPPSAGDTRRQITQVLYDPTQPVTSQGMTLYLEVDSKLRAFTANFIRIKGRPFFIGPAHAFYTNPAASAQDVADSDDDFEIDSDDETDTILVETEVPEVILVRPDSESDPSPDASDDSDEWPEYSDSETRSQSSYNSAGDDSTLTPIESSGTFSPASPKVQFLVHEPPMPPLESLARFGVLSYWSDDKDWALIETHARQDAAISAFYATEHNDLSTLKTANGPPGGLNVVTQTSFSGKLAGTISRSTSDLRVPYGSSFQEVYSVRFNGPLANGDCGSVVFSPETGELYGHIIAGCKAAGFAYIMAASHVLPDVHSTVAAVTARNTSGLSFLVPLNFRSPFANVFLQELYASVVWTPPVASTLSVVGKTSFVARLQAFQDASFVNNTLFEKFTTHRSALASQSPHFRLAFLSEAANFLHSKPMDQRLKSTHFLHQSARDYLLSGTRVKQTLRRILRDINYAGSVKMQFLHEYRATEILATLIQLGVRETLLNVSIMGQCENLEDIEIELLSKSGEPAVVQALAKVLLALRDINHPRLCEYDTEHLCKIDDTRRLTPEVSDDAFQPGGIDFEKFLAMQIAGLAHALSSIREAHRVIDLENAESGEQVTTMSISHGESDPRCTKNRKGQNL